MFDTDTLVISEGLPIISSENHRTLDSYSRTTSASAAQPRLKGESTHEKKERKAAVKEAKVLPQHFSITLIKFNCMHSMAWVSVHEVAAAT